MAQQVHPGGPEELERGCWAYSNTTHCSMKRSEDMKGQRAQEVFVSGSIGRV